LNIGKYCSCTGCLYQFLWGDLLTVLPTTINQKKIFWFEVRAIKGSCFAFSLEPPSILVL